MFIGKHEQPWSSTEWRELWAQSVLESDKMVECG